MLELALGAVASHGDKGEAIALGPVPENLRYLPSDPVTMGCLTCEKHRAHLTILKCKDVCLQYDEVCIRYDYHKVHFQRSH